MFNESPRQMAVICFLPDPGHANMLLLLAQLMKQHMRIEVTCFLPSIFEDEATKLGFSFSALDGIDRHSGNSVFAHLSKRSIFYCAFSHDQDLRDHYWARLHESMSRELPSLVNRLDALRPSLILTDAHVFSGIYAQLAQHFSANHVILEAGGAPLHAVRRFVRVYGLTNVPEWMQMIVEVAGRLTEYGLAFWRRVRQPAQRELTQARISALQTAAANLLGEASPREQTPVRVTIGISTIEQRVANPQHSFVSDRVVRLAPVLDASVSPVPSHLEEWLAQQPRGRVVFVSFGTMVQPTVELLRTIWRGLLDSGASVVWAQPLRQRQWMETESQPERVLVQDFVPQAALLFSELVDCFVTHAGAGSIQEALIGGVPMLCIPFMWDHPYLASVVKRLGVSVNCSRVFLSRRQVRNGVRRLLDDPSYRGRARELAIELRARSAAPEQLAWMRDLYDATNRAQ